MDVRTVAKLAHLEITDEEVALYTPQMAEIVSYVEQLNGLDTENIAPMLGGLTDEGQATDAARGDFVKASLGQKAALGESAFGNGGTFPSSEGSLKKHNHRDTETQRNFIKHHKYFSTACQRNQISKFLCVSVSLWLIVFALFVASCSVPNLEPPECTESRDSVREFYSYHFANDMKFSAENLKSREKFLTTEFAATLKALRTENDVFTTNSMDFPKAFRVGECKPVSPEKTVFTVLLFWRDDIRSEQREITVDTIKRNRRWLISNVTN